MKTLNTYEDVNNRCNNHSMNLQITLGKSNIHSNNVVRTIRFSFDEYPCTSKFQFSDISVCNHALTNFFPVVTQIHVSTLISFDYSCNSIPSNTPTTLMKPRKFQVKHPRRNMKLLKVISWLLSTTLGMHVALIHHLHHQLQILVNKST